MGKGAMSLAIARKLAEGFVEEFSPHCQRIEIAGSIRREKAEVGDIELLYVPRWHVLTEKDMFGTVITEFREDLLDTYIGTQMAREVFTKRMNSAAHPIGYGVKNKALVHVPTGIGVDLFSTEAKNWGMSLLVRTGSADFNVKVMARFRQLHMEGHAYGGITKGDEIIDCPDEMTVFSYLGWPWIDPKDRS